MEPNLYRIDFARGKNNEYVSEMAANRFNSASAIDDRKSRYNSISEVIYIGISEDNW